MGVTFYPAGPLSIRDGAFATLMAAKTALGLNVVSKARTFPKQDGDFPYVAIWMGGDRTEATDTANTGAPFFLHRLALIVDVMVKAATEDDLETEVGTLTEAIRAELLTSLSFLSLVEGIERCDTRYDYPKEATSIMAQGTIEFEITIRSMWEPTLPDLDKVVVTYPPDQAGPILSIDFREHFR